MKNPVTRAATSAVLRSLALLGLLSAAAGPSAALAQQLDLRFSCSTTRSEDLGPTIYADNGEIRLDGTQIKALRWESSLHRSTHGFDCSIDSDDGVQAEITEHGWRLRLKDPHAARAARGYDSEHGANCTVRLERNGDTVRIKPSCPVLCGSRNNFSALSVDLNTGGCRYEE
ncbi:hypothetical protein ACFQAT_02175 [Undibacterium arcticum]|uniref:Uncharacterized protein n=1 Tax=Undibacterium arcticum TaxID=1762892 RepID=A0ABV7F2T0_9BURK